MTCKVDNRKGHAALNLLCDLAVLWTAVMIVVWTFLESL